MRRKRLAAMKVSPIDNMISPSPVSGVFTFLCVTTANAPDQTHYIIAFALLRAFLVLVGLLAPAPTETILTPVGHRLVENVHKVPEGMSFNMRVKRPEITFLF
jgi:hypothetical protein